MRKGAITKLSESRVRIEVLRDCALPCVSALLGLEWIKRALLYQLSYAPTSLKRLVYQLRGHSLYCTFTAQCLKSIARNVD